MYSCCVRYQVTHLLLLVFQAVRDVQKFEFRLLTQQTTDQQRPVETSNEVIETNVFGRIYVFPPTLIASLKAVYLRREGQLLSLE